MSTSFYNMSFSGLIVGKQASKFPVRDRDIFDFDGEQRAADQSCLLLAVADQRDVGDAEIKQKVKNGAKWSVTGYKNAQLSAARCKLEVLSEIPTNKNNVALSSRGRSITKIFS